MTARTLEHAEDRWMRSLLAAPKVPARDGP
jgi:hypothetical protein